MHTSSRSRHPALTTTLTTAGLAAISLAASTVAGRVSPTFSLGIGVRETGSAGAIGTNGGSSGSIEYVGYKASTGNFGKTLTADGTWQTFTYTFGTDDVSGFTGDGILNGTKGVLEMIRFTNTGSVTDPWAIYIDDLTNTVAGTPTVIQNWDSFPAAAASATGAADVTFRNPYYSGSTQTFIVNASSSTNVEADATAPSGANVYKIGGQFVNSGTANWSRMTTFNAPNNPNPVIDFSPGNTISFKMKAIVTPIPRGWNVDADGSWNTAANWQGGLPDSATATARFGTAATPITAPRTVTVNTTVTVTGIQFNTLQSFTINADAGQGILMRGGAGFDNNISSELGSHTINAPFDLGLRLALNVARAQDTLTLNGAVSSINPETIDAIKTGPGKAFVKKLNLDLVTVSAGTLGLSSGGGTSDLNFLTLAGTATAPTAKLDIGNNALVVDYGASAVPAGDPASTTSFATQRSRIIAARNGGLFDGNGIGSSAALSGHAIGIVEASSIGIVGTGTFIDVAVDDTAVLIRYTLAGDTNLDGAVTFPDLLALAQNYDPAFDPNLPAGPKLWFQGDSDYNGIVDFSDLLALAQNYGGTALSTRDALAYGGAGFAADWALAQSLVPEPTTFALLGGIAAMALRRRR